MNKVFNKTNKNDFLIALTLSLVGMAFLIYYIFNASSNVPTTDYIRVINTYISNPYDMSKVLQSDFIVRCPLTYFFRIINVKLFNYSMYFDRTVSALFLSGIAFVAIYSLRLKLINNILKNIVSIIIAFIIFSLNSWEMILNGTAYPIFIFFFMTFIIYNLYEEYIYNNKKSILPIICLIFLTCILIASDYLVALILNFIIVSIIYIFANYKKDKRRINELIKFIAGLFIILIIYYISSHSGESKYYVYDGMQDVSLFSIIIEDPIYILKFVIKCFAGIIIGTETFQYGIQYGTMNESIILLTGIIFIAIIIFTFIIILSKKIYNKSLLPILYMFHSGISVALIFFARYKFMVDTYGMSSRYQVQLMLLPIGIVIALSLHLDEIISNKKIDKIILVIISMISIFFIVYGRTITTIDEMHKASVRKMCFNNAKDIALNIESYPDNLDTDKLFKATFEYSKGTDLIRNAFKILKDNNLNIYSK